MNFSKRKLSIEDAPELSRVDVSAIAPYTLIYAPVYVLLRKNEKFISVLAPLDFFTPADIKRYGSWGEFYFTNFSEQLDPFESAGTRVKTILAWAEGVGAETSGKGAAVPPPTPYEVSDAVLQVVGPLWAEGGTIEPFFTAPLASALCGELPKDLLEDARDLSFDQFEYAILLSSWVLFLALHLGYANLDVLCKLRQASFTDAVFGQGFGLKLGAELYELQQFAKKSLPERDTKVVVTDFFLGFDQRIAQKLSSRFKRVEAELIKPGAEAPTIFGERGFVGD